MFHFAIVREIFPFSVIAISINQQKSELITAGLVRLLRPLVLFLVRQRITFPFFSQLIKQVFFDVGLQQLRQDSEKSTDSRLHLLTGIHRKDLRRFREVEHPGAAPGKTTSVAARLVSYWLSQQPYCDDEGHARPLFRARTQGVPSFEALVDDVSKQDLHARSLIDDLLAQRVVELKDDMVYLAQQAYIPEADFAAKMAFFARGLEQHIAAAENNMAGDKPLLLDRGIYFNNLNAQQVAQLHQLAREQSMAVLALMNKTAAQMQADNTDKQNQYFRFHYGVYFNVESQQENDNT